MCTHQTFSHFTRHLRRHDDNLHTVTAYHRRWIQNSIRVGADEVKHKRPAQNFYYGLSEDLSLEGICSVNTPSAKS